MGKELGDKIVSLMDTLPAAFSNPLPSLHPFDLFIGLCCGAGMRLAVYLKGKNAKKYRHARFLAAMPDYLRPEDVPEDVRRAWHLWQGVPVLFVKLEEGGFEWSYSHSWAKQNRDQFEAFWRFQDGSDALWDWLSAHVAAEIGAHNLLKIWG